jgi:hypothetical protein
MRWETVRWYLANGVLTKSGVRQLRMRITSSLASSWSVLVQSELTKSWRLSLPSETDFRCLKMAEKWQRARRQILEFRADHHLSGTPELVTGMFALFRRVLNQRVSE